MKAIGLVIVATLAAAGCSTGSTVGLSAGNNSPGPTSYASDLPLSVSPTPSPTITAGPGGITATAGTGTTGPGVLVTPTNEPVPTPRPTATKTSESAEVVVTNDNSGDTVKLRVGQRLRVRLTPDSGNWDPPTSGNNVVLSRRSSSGGYPGDQPVDASFVGVGAGSTDVSTQTDMACLHTEPRCLPPQRAWMVHVVVS